MSAKDTQKAQRVEHNDTAETIDAEVSSDVEVVGMVSQNTHGSPLGLKTDTSSGEFRLGD